MHRVCQFSQRLAEHTRSHTRPARALRPERRAFAEDSRAHDREVERSLDRRGEGSTRVARTCSGARASSNEHTCSARRVDRSAPEHRRARKKIDVLALLVRARDQMRRRSGSGPESSGVYPLPRDSCGWAAPSAPFAREPVWYARGPEPPARRLERFLPTLIRPLLTRSCALRRPPRSLGREYGRSPAKRARSSLGPHGVAFEPRACRTRRLLACLDASERFA